MCGGTRFQSAPASLRRENLKFTYDPLPGAVSIRSRLFEAGEPVFWSAIYANHCVSIRSRLFEAGEHVQGLRELQAKLFQSAPASLRRENFLSSGTSGEGFLFQSAPASLRRENKGPYD